MSFQLPDTLSLQFNTLLFQLPRDISDTLSQEAYHPHPPHHFYHITAFFLSLFSQVLRYLLSVSPLSPSLPLEGKQLEGRKYEFPAPRTVLGRLVF